MVDAVTSQTYVLPVPPSVNNLFATVGKRRVKSKEYKAWQSEAGLRLIVARVGRKRKISGYVAIEIGLPINMRGDIDNRIKPIIDLLVKHAVIDDDRNVARVTVTRSVSGDAAYVVARPTTIAVEW